MRQKERQGERGRDGGGLRQCDRVTMRQIDSNRVTDIMDKQVNAEKNTNGDRNI